MDKLFYLHLNWWVTSGFLNLPSTVCSSSNLCPDAVRPSPLFRYSCMNVLRYTIEDLFCIDCVTHCGTLCRFLWLEAVNDSCNMQHFWSMTTAEMGFIDEHFLQLSMSLIRFMDCRGVGILQECWLILWSGVQPGDRGESGPHGTSSPVHCIGSWPRGGQWSHHSDLGHTSNTRLSLEGSEVGREFPYNFQGNIISNLGVLHLGKLAVGN